MANLSSSSSSGGLIGNGSSSGGGGGGGLAPLLLPVVLCASVSMGVRKCHITEGCNSESKTEYKNTYKPLTPPESSPFELKKEPYDREDEINKKIEEGAKELIKKTIEPIDTSVNNP